LKITKTTTVDAHYGAITAIAQRSRGGIFSTAGSDGFVHEWNEHGLKRATTRVNVPSVSRLAYSDAGHLLVTDNRGASFCPNDKDCDRTYSRLFGRHASAFLLEGRQAVVAHGNKVVFKALSFDDDALATSQVLLPDSEDIVSLHLVSMGAGHDEGSLLIARSSTQTAYLLTIQFEYKNTGLFGRGPSAHVPSMSNTGSIENCIAICFDLFSGTICAATKNRVSVYNSSNLATLVSFSIGGESAVVGLVYLHGDRGGLITIHETGTINSWDIQNAKKTQSLSSGTGKVTCLTQPQGGLWADVFATVGENKVTFWQFDAMESPPLPRSSPKPKPKKKAPTLEEKQIKSLRADKERLSYEGEAYRKQVKALRAALKQQEEATTHAEKRVLHLTGMEKEARAGLEKQEAELKRQQAEWDRQNTSAQREREVERSAHKKALSDAAVSLARIEKTLEGVKDQKTREMTAKQKALAKSEELKETIRKEYGDAELSAVQREARIGQERGMKKAEWAVEANKKEAEEIKRLQADETLDEETREELIEQTRKIFKGIRSDGLHGDSSSNDGGY
jgi:hypothetical protein